MSVQSVVWSAALLHSGADHPCMPCPCNLHTSSKGCRIQPSHRIVFIKQSDKNVHAPKNDDGLQLKPLITRAYFRRQIRDNPSHGHAADVFYRNAML